MSFCHHYGIVNATSVTEYSRISAYLFIDVHRSFKLTSYIHIHTNILAYSMAIIETGRGKHKEQITRKELRKGKDMEDMYISSTKR